MDQTYFTKMKGTVSIESTYTINGYSFFLKCITNFKMNIKYHIT
jgi:hypothetical protein